MTQSSLGFVVIGRNEGSRLIKCLESIIPHSSFLVYVDSCSVDNSLENASNFTKNIIILDNKSVLSAARARNEGFKFLIEKYPQLKYIQFIDGDCILSNEWIENAIQFISTNKSYAIACGRRKEIFLENNIYHYICDIEWNTPIGEAASCGGDFLCDVEAFKQVKGFDQSIIAGEEPEMCYRLRQKGWKIRRLDSIMTYHDASIYKLRQLIIRIKRSGYATALWFFRYGFSDEKFMLREFLRIVVWGFLFPMSFFLALFFNSFLSAIFILVILIQIYRISKSVNSEYPLKIRIIYALSIIFGKPFEFLGAIKYFLTLVDKSKISLYEYK